MRMKSFALAAGFAAISVLGTAGAASAETAGANSGNVQALRAVAGKALECENILYKGKVRGGMCFESNGDKVFAGDFLKDGLWIRTDWQTNYGRSGDCRDGNSKGDGNWCNFNMAEKGKVKLQGEVWNGKKRVYSGPWTNYLPIG